MSEEREEQKFPEANFSHPLYTTRWLCKLDDWVDGYDPGKPFIPSGNMFDPEGAEIYYVPQYMLKRLKRESRAYYAMRKQFRETNDYVLLLQAEVRAAEAKAK